MLTQSQINEIKRQAKLKGYTDQQIVSSLAMMTYGSGQNADQVSQIPNSGQAASNVSSVNSSQMSSPSKSTQTEGSVVGNFFKTLYDPGVSQQQELSGFKKVIQTAADAAPVVMGTVAGIAGGALGAAAGGVGAVPGGAIGTGIGVAAGKALENAIESLIGTQDQTPINQVKEQVVDATTAAAIDFVTGGVLEKVAPVAGAVKKFAGEKIAEAGEKLALKAIRPSPSQQARFAETTGMELKDFAVKNGLFEKGVQQVEKLIAPIQKSFDSIAESSGIKVTVKSITDKFDEQINFLRSIPESKIAKVADALEENKKLFLDRFGNKSELTANEITTVRRNIDQIIPESQWAKDPLEMAVSTQTRSVYQSSLQDAAGDVVVNGKNLKQLGSELQKLYSFRDIASTQQYLGEGSLPIGIVKSISLAMGATVGGGASAANGGDLASTVRGGLIGMGLVTFANNPKVVSFVVQNLIKNGEAIKGATINQQGQIISQVVRRSLTNLGAVNLSVLGQDDSIDNPGSINNTSTNQEPGSDSLTTKPTDGIGNQNNSQKKTDTAHKDNLSQAVKPFGGRSKNELLQLALAQGATLKDLNEISSIYDMVVPNETDVDALLKKRKSLSEAGFSTDSIDKQLSDLGITKGEAGKKDLVSQINNISTVGERNGARAVKDILDVVTSAITTAKDTPTGPIAAAKAGVSKLTKPNKTAQLEKDLNEILRTIRKESTGVAFSPQEIADLLKEIPSITQQEGNVEDFFKRLRIRMLQKLQNFGLDITGEMSE